MPTVGQVPESTARPAPAKAWCTAYRFVAGVTVTLPPARFGAPGSPRRSSTMVPLALDAPT